MKLTLSPIVAISGAPMRNDDTDFRYARWICANKHFVAVANTEAKATKCAHSTAAP
jgi:hypothetical protein